MSSLQVATLTGLGTLTASASAMTISGAQAGNVVQLGTFLSVTINCSLGNYFSIGPYTAGGVVTFTFSNVIASGVYSFVLEYNTIATTSITWPNTVVWPGNVAPNITGNRTHYFVFITDNGGASWRGIPILDFPS
jgi:hypothetical protein